MSMNSPQLACFVLLAALSGVGGCSDGLGSAADSSLPALSGGATGAGGSTIPTGGSLSTSGGSLGAGGARSSGGALGSGGNQAGGGPSGGSPSGGAPDNGAGGSSSGTGGENSGGSASGGSGGSAGPMLPPVTDYAAEGPYSTLVENGVGPNGAYMIVRPEVLGEDGFLHAPIIFGPGIGQMASVHTTMLRNFASHGFVVVGTPVLSGGPGDAGNRQKMQDGLDWIVQQNTSPGIYQGKIWVDHAVSMGFSVGGTSAVEIGGDDAVLTVVSIHGHRATAELHGTMLQTTGTGDTVGMPLQQQTYDSSEVPTFLATLTGANHGYIEQNGGGNERPAILAWMRYWIYGDSGAEPYFFGADCTLCEAPWENPQRKNWD